MKTTSLKHRITKVAAVAACAALILSGCGKKQLQETGASVTYPAGGTYPVQCEDKLTLWMELNSSQSSLMSNFGESPFAQELAKKTGISVEYMHPAAGLANEQFNLLLTSNDMPDIIVGNWDEYGGQKAIDEGLIQSLGDIMDKWAPNYKKVLSERPDIDKMLKTDEGNYYAFGFIREDKALGVYGGPIIRADWLKKVNMEIPETIDEWEAMLTAFKEQLGCETPLMLADSAAPFKAGMICGAYGVTDNFYLDDGKVKYGPIQPGYKDFVLLMKSWYDKGLLDKNFSGADTKILDNAMMNGKTGATYQLVGGGMGTWLSAMKANGDKEFDLTGAPYPVLKKGDVPEFSQMDWQYTPLRSWAISRDCKNVELAARLLDYGYSEEGYNLFNYGTEGLTYELKDGKPAFTEFALNNPDGLTLGNILTQYAMSSSSGPCLQSLDVVTATRSFPQQTAAIEKWKVSNEEEHKLPMVSFTQEESSELGTILTDLHTYQDETLYGFVMGTEDVNNWDEYLSRMEGVGAVKATEIYQKAVDRFMKR